MNQSKKCRRNYLEPTGKRAWPRHLGPNTILDTRPPAINDSELTLGREDRVHLCKLRCGHHSALMSYQSGHNSGHLPRLSYSPTQHYTHHGTLPHTLTTQNATQHKQCGRPVGNPIRAVVYLRGAGLFGQRLGTATTTEKISN